MNFIKLFLLIFISFLLGLWIKQAMGSINNGMITWTPNGAVSYSIWRANPGTTSPQLQGVVVTPPYAVSGVIEDGTLWWLKGNYLLDSGQCCKENDLQFIVTPPLTNNVAGTNSLRFVTAGQKRILQVADTPAGPWIDLVDFTNPPPAHLTTQQKQMFRLKTLTNSPPPLP